MINLPRMFSNQIKKVFLSGSLCIFLLGIIKKSYCEFCYIIEYKIVLLCYLFHI